MLEGLPRPFVDFLKVQAIIRGAATKLGSALHDRLRINTTYALKVILWTLLHSALHDLIHGHIVCGPSSTSCSQYT